MSDYTFVPYEGNEPYIFISYAHKDTEAIFPILESLYQNGYRFWYDDGIAPGSEWPENIAQHLENCAMTLAFISPNSVASENCRREINFALSRKKPFLSVTLVPTTLTPGMELQLSSQQSVLKFKYHTYERFLDKLFSCTELKPCKIPQAEDEPEASAAPVGQQKPVKKPAPKKKLWAVLAAVLLLAVLCIGFFALRSCEKICRDMHTATLVFDNMTEDDHADALSALESRLEVFAGSSWSLSETEESDRMQTLSLPHDALGQADLTTVLRLLTADGMPYFSSRENPVEDLFALPESVQSVTVHKGSINGVDAADFGLEADTYSYLELKLTADAASNYAEQLSALAGGPLFVMNPEPAAAANASLEAFCLPAVSFGDGQTYYLINNTGCDGLSDLLAHILLAPRTKTISFKPDYQYQWQSLLGDGSDGSNQQESAEISENPATIIYQSDAANRDSVSIVQTQHAMKQRFDLLGQPYCFGTTEDLPGAMVFRTGAERLNEIVIELLCAQPVVGLEGALAQNDSLFGSFHTEAQSDGSVALVYTENEVALDKMEEFTTYISKQPDRTLYLTIDGIRFASLQLEEAVTDGQLRFTNCRAAGLDTVTSENAYLFDLAADIFNNKGTQVQYPTLKYTEVSDAFGLPLSLMEEELTDLTEQVHQIYEPAVVNAAGSSLSVSLGLPVNDTLITEGLTLAKRIYTTIEASWKSSSFSDLTIILAQEDAATHSAQLHFSKKPSIADGIGTAMSVGTVDVSSFINTGELLTSYTENSFSQQAASLFQPQEETSSGFATDTVNDRPPVQMPTIKPFVPID